METGSRDLNWQSAPVNIPRCILGRSQEEPSHELAKGLVLRSLRHLLAGSVASLAAKKESVQGRGLVGPICTAEAKDPGSDSSSSLRAKKF